MPIYVDSSFNYFCPNATDDPATVTMRNTDIYTTVAIPPATQASNISGAIWVITTLTDLGAVTFNALGVATQN